MNDEFNSIDMAGMPEPERIEVNGAGFPLVRVGRGAPILFVHGAWADHRIWCGFWRRVSRSAQFMAVTQRHFGSTPWPDDKPFARRIHIKDLAALLTELGEPVHLAGWSYAGGILLGATAAVPDQVLSLTIFEPSFECEPATEAGQLQRARDAAWKRLEAAYDLAERGGPKAGMRAGIEGVYGLEDGGFFDLHPDFQTVHLENSHTMLPDLHAEPAVPLTPEQWARIRCPALILYGENSLEQYRLMAEFACASLENAKLSMIEGVSHGGPVQRPDILAAATLDFVLGLSD